MINITGKSIIKSNKNVMCKGNKKKRNKKEKKWTNCVQFYRQNEYLCVQI